MDRDKVIAKLEKEVQQTYLTKTTVFQNGEKVSEEINAHREPYVSIRIEMADEILALLKEQEEEIRQLRLALDIAKGACKGISVEGQ